MCGASTWGLIQRSGFTEIARYDVHPPAAQPCRLLPVPVSDNAALWRRSAFARQHQMKVCGAVQVFDCAIPKVSGFKPSKQFLSRS